MDDLSDPIVNAQASVLHDHLLQVVELVTLIVIRLQVLYELSNVLLSVHDFIRLLKLDSLDHHLGCATLLNDKELEQVILVDLMNKFIDLDVAHDVLALAAAGKMHEPITVSLAFDAQLFIDGVDVRLLQESLWARSHFLTRLSLNGGLRD